MDSWFRDADKPNQNLIGKNPGQFRFAVTKDGGSVDAITASTITSRAFLEALSLAFDAWEKEKRISGETGI
jgi:electron transport complex protein RnfG